MWVTVLGHESPNSSLEGPQLPQVSGMNVLFVSEESGGPDAISLYLLFGCGSEQLGEGRETATDANVLENGNEVFVILSIDLGQFHASSDALVPRVSLCWCASLIRGEGRGFPSHFICNKSSSSN